MSLFTSVLQGLQKKIDAQNSYKEIVIQSIKESVGIILTPEAIGSLKDGVLTMKLNPTIKMALLLKQPLIIKTLQKNGLKVSTMK